MELIIIILLVACIVWLVVKVRRSALASEHATLNARVARILDYPKL